MRLSACYVGTLSSCLQLLRWYQAKRPAPPRSRWYQGHSYELPRFLLHVPIEEVSFFTQFFDPSSLLFFSLFTHLLHKSLSQCHGISRLPISLFLAKSLNYFLKCRFDTFGLLCHSCSPSLSDSSHRSCCTFSFRVSKGLLVLSTNSLCGPLQSYLVSLMLYTNTNCQQVHQPLRSL